MASLRLLRQCLATVNPYVECIPDYTLRARVPFCFEIRSYFITSERAPIVAQKRTAQVYHFIRIAAGFHLSPFFYGDKSPQVAILIFVTPVLQVTGVWSTSKVGRSQT